MPKDWHPEDVKAAIRKTGCSMSDLSRRHGLSATAVRRALVCPWPRVQAIIARHLGHKPQDIWPSRYDARGRPLRGLRATDRTHRSAARPDPHRQKEAAA